jgi:hypothetical protein
MNRGINQIYVIIWLTDILIKFIIIIIIIIIINGSTALLFGFGRFFSFLILWSEFVATDPEIRVRFPALPDFLGSSGSGTGSTPPREYN